MGSTLFHSDDRLYSYLHPFYRDVLDIYYYNGAKRTHHDRHHKLVVVAAAVQNYLVTDIHNSNHCYVSSQNCGSSSFSYTHRDFSFVHQTSLLLFGGGCHRHSVDDGVDTHEDVEGDTHLQHIEVVEAVASSLDRDKVVDTPVGEEEEVVEDPHNELLVVA